MVKAGASHCVFAWRSLHSALDPAVSVPSPTAVIGEDSEVAAPLFVTWTVAADNDALRGCIGTFAAPKLGSGLEDFAQTAALRDDRFLPVSLAELTTLACGVSILGEFEEAAHALDWQVGVHGIRIEFTHPARRMRLSATYLPEVAAEQRWTREQAIYSLVRKAGWTGETIPLAEIRLERYRSSKWRMDWDEYQVAVSTTF